MTREEALAIVAQIDSEAERVSDWAADFLDSLLKQADNTCWQPSERQSAKLLELYEEYFG